MQMEATECGAACLTMILAHFGRWEPLEQVRKDCGVSRDGSKAKNILLAARRYGLEAKGYSYDLEALKANPELPCILFWNFSHFVVLTGFSSNGKWAYINDPARGSVRVDMEEFDRAFTGVVLIFRTTERFVKDGKPASMIDFVRERLKGMVAPVVFITITSAILSTLGIFNAAMSRVFMDKVLGGGAESGSWLSILIGVLLVIAVAECVIMIINAIYLIRIRGKMAVTSSSKFMWHLLHLPVDFYSQRYVGDLQQRQESNETIATTLIQQLAPTLINLVLIVLYLVVMFAYSVTLALVGIITVAINVFVARIVSKKRVNVTRQQVRDRGKLYSTTIAGIDMIESIKSSGSEEGFFARWSGLQALVNEGDVRYGRLNAILGTLPAAVVKLANVVVLIIGAWLIMNGEFTVGALVAFQGFLSSFMSPVQEVIGLGQSVQEMRTQMERIQDVMDYEVDVPETYEDEESVEGLSKLSGAIDIEHLSFGYSELDPPIIEDFDLHVEPGKWVALVGGSGSGKSTVAKLICGLHTPWEGTIAFDGVNIEDVPREQFRGSVALVAQDIVTFAGTVADNVRMWDESIEGYEVIMACRDAGIHDDIIARDGGYRSEMLPGGRNFSGGQLQRLEIAHVLALDPTIIVMDEATSALDAKTEAQVIESIRKRDTTCIVVAHRLSTIRDCDEIIVFDSGKVVERGTHEELLAKNGAYAELVRSA